MSDKPSVLGLWPDRKEGEDIWGQALRLLAERDAALRERDEREEAAIWLLEKLELYEGWEEAEEANRRWTWLPGNPPYEEAP